MTPCAGNEAFRFADGTSVRDLNELRHCVATKSPHLVAHHREHYAPWIAGILGDPALSRKVARLALRRTIVVDAYRAELVAIMDERIGKLKTRVI